MEYRIPGTISHKTPQKTNGKSEVRYGVQFQSPLSTSLNTFLSEQKDTCFVYKSQERPHVVGADPFFFEETLFFTVHGVFATGLLLEISTDCNSILPHSTLSLSIQIPGRSEFLVKGTVLPHFCFQKNRHYFVLAYDQPSMEFLHAMSENIILFAAEATPQVLRQHGFQVGKLDHAFHLSNSKIPADHKKNSNFFCALLDTETPSRHIPSGENTRYLLCKVGPHVVGSLGVHFVQPGEGSQLRSDRRRESMPNWITDKQYIEILDFYMNGQAKLIDFFFELLKQVIHFGTQSQSHALLLECAPSFREGLAHIGFEEIHATEIHLMALPLKKFLQKDPKMGADMMWNQMNREWRMQAAKRKVSP